MIVLGLHFGRNASISVVKDGKPLVLLQRERVVRHKQAMFLRPSDIDQALAYCSLTFADIDRCAVAVSDGAPLVLLDPDELFVASCDIADQQRDAFSRDVRCCPDDKALLVKAKAVSFDDAGTKPTEITYRGCSKPCDFVNASLAGAACSYYSSGFDPALVLSLDDGQSYIGQGGALTSVGSFNACYASIYAEVARAIGLGELGGAGKLMGLAPYGKPSFFRDDDLDLCFLNNGKASALDKTKDWIDRCRSRASEAGYEVVRLPSGDDKLMSPFVLDLAASTQRLFETAVLSLITQSKDRLAADNVCLDALCLSGAAALNCPANSRVFASSGFQEIFIPPCCDESGLSLGAALSSAATYFHERGECAQHLGYLGCAPSSEDYEDAIASFGSKIVFEPIENVVEAAALALASNQIIAWYEGRSEVGPRALGHRSILANPTDSANWRRVNGIKRRESWRPFAPAVLEECVADYFSGGPTLSKYMLFTHKVISSKIPATTHVDGSARIQTVGPECGAFHDLLQAFFAKSGVPILLNTSFNGPAEPVVETPVNAIQTFLDSSLDALFFPSGIVRLTG